MESSEIQQQSPGAILRAERERRGISPREMADRLNWMPSYVTAIEENRFEVLRGTAFVRGYLRAYAKQVGLSESDLLTAFEAMQPLASKSESEKLATPGADQVASWRRPEVGIAAGVLCAVLLIAALWWAQNNNTAEQPAVVTVVTDGPRGELTEPPVPGSEPGQVPDSTAGFSDRGSSGVAAVDDAAVAVLDAEVAEQVSEQVTEQVAAEVTEKVAAEAEVQVEAAELSPASESPVFAGAESAAPELVAGQPTGAELAAPASAVTPATAATVSQGDELLQFSFSGDCWLEVRDGSDTLIYADLRRDGDQLGLDGIPPFSILVGDARRVKLFYADTEVAIVPPPGRVVTRFSVGEP